jgi:uncharacterized protein (TIGR03435 family)
MGLRAGVFSILMASALFGQSATFVAADVHAAPKQELSFSSEDLGPGNRVLLRAQTLAHMIALAYGVDDDKISGGPRWLDADKFDVVAKPPTTTQKKSEMQWMLQALLAERFQLKVRKEDKPFPVYVWTPAKGGLKLTLSKSETDGGCEAQPGNGFFLRVCTGLTIEGFAEPVRMFSAGYFDRNVVDRTSAKGRYDFTLKWSGRGLIGHTPDAISLFDVLEKQYGIKTDQDRLPFPAIVVESVNETPAPNPPDTNALLPPMPTEFEVAVIKINKDPQARGSFHSDHGRVDGRAIPLKTIIEFAYGVDDDDMIAGAPSWADHELCDIVAKTDPSVDFIGMQPMLQKLLGERFHLQTHREDRPVEVYALTVGKNPLKLAPGDPAARGVCQRSVINRLITATCENTTTAEFAEKVRGFAPGYIDHTVADLTGLKGAFNFAVGWNDRLVTDPSRRQGGSADAPADAQDPGAGITFFSALEKIGLKMTKEKHPMPVLVVDRIDRAPEN